MAKELEDDLKAENWLSMLTFDAFRYASLGRPLIVEWSDDGLLLKLPGLTPDSNGINKKFLRLVGDNEPAGIHEV